MSFQRSSRVLFSKSIRSLVEKDKVSDGPQILSRNLSSVSPEPIRFDGQTAIVTGAGRGLGKEYAKLLASRGANVIVNDLEGSTSGELASGGNQSSLAEETAKEIQTEFAKSSNKVIANKNSITCAQGVKSLVASAMDHFGRIDILINNAGILRDKSFANMSLEDWDLVQQVHLQGSFLATHACWPIMRKQSYGRIIMTTSPSGIYGNFGQANYAAAKMGLIGLSNTLVREGAKYNVQCNVIAPVAATRMTENMLPEDYLAALHPRFVAPMVVWLCHKTCPENGAIYEAAGGWYARYKMVRSRGALLGDIDGPEEDKCSLEKIAEHMGEINNFDLTNSDRPVVDSFESLMVDLGASLSGKNNTK